MLSNQQITDITRQVAAQRIAKANLERVVAEPATDSEGNDALRIILVLEPDEAKKLSGDDALDMLVAIQESLRAAGEERFPIVEYATEQELTPEGGGQEDSGEQEDDV